MLAEGEAMGEGGTVQCRYGHCCCYTHLIFDIMMQTKNVMVNLFLNAKDTNPKYLWLERFILTQCYIVKNIRRFYGKITGNQLPVHFPLFFYRRP